MKRKLTQTLFLVVLFTIILPDLLQAKGTGQWFLTPRIGTAFLMSEASGLSTVPNDFKNGNGFSADIALSRTIGSHLELGINAGFYQFSSKDDSTTIPDLSSYFSVSDPRINESQFNGLFTYNTAPIEYNTSCFTTNFFVRYYIKKFPTRTRDAQKVQPYIEVSVGQNFMNTELVYKDPSTFIDKEQFTVLPSVWIPYPYEEGKDVAPYKSPENSLQYALGVGSRFNLNGGVTLTLAAELSSVQTQYMDGTPNLRADNVTAGLVPRIMFGIAIPLNQGHSKGNYYLPWAPN